MKRLTTLAILATSLLDAACGVRSTAPQDDGVKSGKNSDDSSDTKSGDTGATDVADANVTFGDAAAAAEQPSARGFYVFTTNYDGAASVGAVGLDGEVLSQSLLSSGSTLPGLSLGLSPDIVPPTQRQTEDELVIIDRGNHALDWLDFDTAQVTAQLGVGPGGFAANPYDYVRVNAELAFVTRYETNRAPGKAKLDESGDLLVINPQSRKLLGRVDFSHLVSRLDGVQPFPTKMVHHDGRLHVVLGMLTEDYAARNNSVLVTVDVATREVVQTLDLTLANCEDVQASPQGLAAVGCRGDWADDPITKRSGIVTVDLTANEPEVAKVYPADDLGGQLSTLDFASESLIVFSVYGDFFTDAKDAAFTLDLSNGKVSKPLLETGPFQLGHIRCVPEHAVCVMANADEFAVEFFDVTAKGLTHSQSVGFDSGVGLAPRYIGVF
jgi:hypothetical protein